MKKKHIDKYLYFIYANCVFRITMLTGALSILHWEDERKFTFMSNEQVDAVGATINFKMVNCCSFKHAFEFCYGNKFTPIEIKRLVRNFDQDAKEFIITKTDYDGLYL